MLYSHRQGGSPNDAVVSIPAPKDFFNLEDVADSVFYGFRMDWATGKLRIEKIDPTDPSPISLPDAAFDANGNRVVYSERDNDYSQWLFTKNTLQFSWNNSDTSRLLVEVL
jgi:hypothetical protein